MKLTKCLIVFLFLITGCTIPETLFITNNSDDVCTITKLAACDRNLKEIKRGQPYLPLSTSPKLESKIKDGDFNKFSEKLEYKIVDNDSIEIQLPSKSSIYFSYSEVSPGKIDRIHFKNEKKEMVFSRKTFRKSFEKPANYKHGYLYVFRD